MTPVLRRTASAGAPAQLTLLGVPADAIADLDGWQDRFSPLSRSELIDRIEPKAPPALRGAPLPADASELALPYELQGGAVTLTAVVLQPNGLFSRIDLGTASSRSGTLRAPIPPDAARGRVVALELARPLSVEGHGDFARVDGVLTLGARCERRRKCRSTDYTGWIGLDGVRRDRLEAPLPPLERGGEPSLPAAQATDATPPAVVATPGLAAAAGAGGLLPLRLPGGVVPVRVVGTINRFPSVSGDFVLGDERSLFVAMNAASPGTAVPNELWLAGPDALGAKLERPPFAALSVSSRAALEDSPSRRPARPRLARRARRELRSSPSCSRCSASRFLLAGDVRDERGELFDLETQGAGPGCCGATSGCAAVLVAGARPRSAASRPRAARRPRRRPRHA